MPTNKQKGYFGIKKPELIPPTKLKSSGTFIYIINNSHNRIKSETTFENKWVRTK